ncbi:hypothetical protein [Flavobacterium tibetense]|uniref:Lipoprotein n=1 Tax=Flavobacterium tibetense TaxID=2233533 RepID=A0A365P258_9FLAO|nr:hypothetical protein [Flavobacterium tibetense]RBA28542.1 hypothetical protein DPN68_05875 [Flavobacterium tibetense]
MKNGLAFLFILLVACKPDVTEVSNLQQQIDSLSLELKTLKQEIQKDSIPKEVLVEEKESQPNKPTVLKEVEVPQPKEEIAPKKKENPVVSSKNDTTYHYFNDGRLSVKIAPRSERQKIWIYLPNGEVIYELENILMSYSSHNTLYFRTDGSLERVSSSFNPGASLYMYKTETYFQTNNEPKYKLEEKTPNTLEEQMNNKWLWNSKTRSWVKQEIVIETNFPKQ